MVKGLAAAMLLLPAFAYGGDTLFKKYVGKTYWPRDQYGVSLNKGACDETLRGYVHRPGEYFKVTNGNQAGLNIEFSNGDMGCIKGQDVEKSLEKCSDTEPASQFLNKKFWLKNLDSSDHLYRGNCEQLKEWDRVVMQPKTAFTINRYVYGRYDFDDKVEAVFDDGTQVCFKAYKVQHIAITEPPEIQEAKVVKELETAGIKVGGKIWVRYPDRELQISGLTHLTVTEVTPCQWQRKSVPIPAIEKCTTLFG